MTVLSLIAEARALESLREYVLKLEESDWGYDDMFSRGWKSATSEVRREIDSRTVTLMERIYAELVYDEVPFEED